jgi:ligand-binding sensor domain-containing protein
MKINHIPKILALSFYLILALIPFLLLSACGPFFYKKNDSDNKIKPTALVKVTNMVSSEENSLSKTKIPAVIYPQELPSKIISYKKDNWIQYQSEELMDLYHGSIYDIAFDDVNKSIWFGSNAGIAQLRDKNWNTFNGTYENASSFPILLDKNQVIWASIRTTPPKIANYNGYVWKFIDKSLLVNTMVMDNNGAIWFGGKYQGANLKAGSNIVVFKDNSWVNIKVDNDPDIEIFDMKFDFQHNLWCGTNKGLFVYDKKNWFEVRINDLYPNYFNSIIPKIVISKDNAIWMIIDRSLVSYKEGVSTIFKNKYLNDFQPSTDIFIDKNEDIWVGGIPGNLNSPLIKFDKKSWEMFQMPLGYTVFKINQAPDNTIWIGTGSAAYQYKPTE